MAKRKGLSKKTRFEVFKRDSFTCQYCGRSAPEVVLNVDHINPVSKDGEDDILNLITSCFDCNQGKKDRLLSDNSVVSKQKKQLDELQERREQIEMLLEWRQGLKDIGEIEIDAADSAWRELTESYHLSENGRLKIKKLIEQFGLNEVLDAIEQSRVYLGRGENGLFTSDSVEIAFSKIGGICRLAQQPEWKKELYYIRGICRNRFAIYNEAEFLQDIQNYYEAGISIQQLRYFAFNATSWTSFHNKAYKALQEMED